MTVQSLRAEFVLAGSALLLVLGWAWEALRRLNGWDQLAVLRYFLERPTSTGAWLFAVATALTLAYVLGAFLVQITFERPTRKWIKKIKDARVKELWEIDKELRVAAGGSGPEIGSSRSVLLQQAFGLDQPGDQKLIHLIQSLGRSALNEESNSQYNYRRANRQIFVGILPALVLSPLPVSLTICNIAGEFDWTVWIISFVAAVIIVVAFFVLVLKPAAKYQEEIAQGLILDAAFLERWNDREQRPPQSV